MSYFALTFPVLPKISPILEMTKAQFVTVQSIIAALAKAKAFAQAISIDI
jgi:hypothetical protein